jgi:aminomethyltransferase
MEAVNSPAINQTRKTSLNALHHRLGAKTVNFGGWDMPVEYPSTGGLVAEHKAVRGSVGLFDVSHMGDIRIHSGRTPGGALVAVQNITMNDASHLAIGQAQYSAMLYPQGTFVDDVIVHRLGEDDFLLVINAGTREKDINWVRQNTKEFDCVVEDLSDTYTQLAIQGPRAVDVLEKLTDTNLTPIKNYWFTHGSVCGLKNVLIARTGYTGEDGFELFTDAARAPALFDALLEAGRAAALKPCGLGARDTLRMEAGLPLYGHELDRSITPFEAGLTPFIRFGRNFIGEAAIAARRESGTGRRLIGIRTEDGRSIGRQGYKLYRGDDSIGVITSGTFAPSFNRPLAMAYVAAANQLEPGASLAVEIRNRREPATIVALPFYRRTKGDRPAPQPNH